MYIHIRIKPIVLLVKGKEEYGWLMMDYNYKFSLKNESALLCTYMQVMCGVCEERNKDRLSKIEVGHQDFLSCVYSENTTQYICRS